MRISVNCSETTSSDPPLYGPVASGWQILIRKGDRRGQTVRLKQLS